jgi:hypothetical protein
VGIGRTSLLLGLHRLGPVLHALRRRPDLHATVDPEAAQ